MPRLIDAHLRHARHFLRVLSEADRLFKSGSDSLERGVALFDAERANIDVGRAWSASHATETPDAAALCAAYPNVGAHFLAMRLTPAELIRWLRDAADAAVSLDDAETASWHVGNLGRVYLDTGDPYLACECFERVLVASREFGDKSSEIKCMMNLSSAHSIMGDQVGAIDFARQGLALAEEIGETRDRGGCLGKIGTAHSRMGDAASALPLYLEQLRIAEAAGDLPSQAEAVNNTALCYMHLGRYDLALTWLVRAVAIYEQLGYESNTIAVLNNIGLVHMNTGAFGRAIETFERQAVLSRAWEDPYGEGRALINHAIALDMSGRRAEAIPLAEAALVILEGAASFERRGVREMLEEWRAQPLP